MKKMNLSACAECDLAPREKICLNPEGKGGKHCPTLIEKGLCGEAGREYDKTDIREFARQASIQEGACYIDRDRKPYVMHPTKPRILEICEFARRMNYNRLGLVFCIGLAKEAAIVAKILKGHGFENAFSRLQSGGGAERGDRDQGRRKGPHRQP